MKHKSTIKHLNIQKELLKKNLSHAQCIFTKLCVIM